MLRGRAISRLSTKTVRRRHLEPFSAPFTYAFGYDAADRLKTASVGGNASRYACDGDGKRVSKVQDRGRRFYQLRP